MFELIFGLVWTAFSGLMALMFYCGDSGVTVNGTWVPQEQFNEMLWPKLFIGLFVLIGVVITIKGLAKILSNVLTTTQGEEVYGIIVDIYPNGTYINGRPVFDAEIAIVEDNGMIGMYKETVGMSCNKYFIGDFLRLKHYKKDVNILEKVDSILLPSQTRDRLEREAGIDRYSQRGEQHDNGYDFSKQEVADAIIINGVEYTRKK